jgi:hypothetical protein
MEKGKSVNLFAEWNQAMSCTRFKTGSPYPEQDYYYSEEALPMCQNTAAFFPDDMPLEEIKEYCIIEAAKIRFNNPGYSAFQIQTVLTYIAYGWKGNFCLSNNKLIVNKFLREAVDIVSGSDKYKDFIEFDYRHHWYGDSVEKTDWKPVKGKLSQRVKLKLLLRMEETASKISSNLVLVSKEYQKENNGVLPTVKELSELSGVSPAYVNKLGHGLFVSKAENTKTKVKTIRLQYPDITQQKVADMLGITTRTVKMYWHIV